MKKFHNCGSTHLIKDLAGPLICMDALLLPDEFKVASVHEFISVSHFANHISLQLRTSKPILDISVVV